MSDGIDGSVVALATPEFSIKRILRPYKGFEQVYQGVTARRPICFCERNQPFDPIAARGTPGYDPNLVYGIPGNMGVRATIEFPILFWIANQTTVRRYQYSLTWRLRNTRDHNSNPNQRVPYHVAKSGAGVAETNPPNPGPRVPIYGVNETAVYAQAEPAYAPNPDPAVAVLRKVVVEPQFSLDLPPLMPDGNIGVIQQGILAPNPQYLHTSAYFHNHETQAIGDDLVISVSRDTSGGGTWDFAPGGADYAFSTFFGNGFGVEYEDLGILLSWGVSP
jgi:hypothetical protein